MGSMTELLIDKQEQEYQDKKDAWIRSRHEDEGEEAVEGSERWNELEDQWDEEATELSQELEAAEAAAEAEQ